MSNSPWTVAKDGRVIAAENELTCLLALSKFGHLRLSEICRAVWPATPVSCASPSAGRMLKRLVKEQAIIARINSRETNSFVLGQRGCWRLLQAGVAVESGLDLSTTGPLFRHHCLVSRYLLERAAKDGVEVWGQHAIDRGLAPLTRGECKDALKKIPDGFAAAIRGPGAAGVARLVDWHEGEGTRKNLDETIGMVRLATHTGRLIGPAQDDPGQAVRLRNLVFVFDVRQQHEPVLIEALAALLRTLPEPDRARVLRAIVFVRVKLGRPRDAWLSYEEVPASIPYGLAVDAGMIKKPRALSWKAQQAQEVAARKRADAQYAIDSAEWQLDFARRQRVGK
jgi:hypothetical protein